MGLFEWPRCRMSTIRRGFGAGAFAIGFWTMAGSAWGQGPTIPARTPRSPGAEQSLLGSSPGALTPPSAFGGKDTMLGGRMGPSVPRVPSSATAPPQRSFGVPRREGITAPAGLPLARVPLVGPLSAPPEPEDEGPPDGMTLDQAIERLVHENLGLRARALEIPQAEADILTASLRANPLFYADGQLVPYGTYTPDRPGGQTQYDINITWPIDVTHKRKARTLVAQQARNVLQAQYQDAVRIQIGNLYMAFADVLGARATIRYATRAREGLAEMLARNQTMFEKGSLTIAEVSRIQSLNEAAEIEVMNAEEALRVTKRNLGVLLNMPGPEAEALEIRGTIHDTFPPPPPIEELVPMAVSGRPDVIAYRMGVGRADAEIGLARANRMQNIYLLYQPYTFQNNVPIHKKGPVSWALGVTVPLPLFDRNQGNIMRSKFNLEQTRLELAEREQITANEVRQALREYELTRKAVQRMETGMMPPATRVRDDAKALYDTGEESLFVYLTAQREFNEASRQYRDMLVRHRRAMFQVNTAVGRRLLP